MESHQPQHTEDWPGKSINLEKLKDSFLLLKQKMCKSHELIQRYNDKLKECENLKTERDALKKETKKMTYNYNTALAKIIKLEHQNTEFKKNNENLLKTVSDDKIKISSDQQLMKQLTCKMNELEEKHSETIMELDLEKSCLKDKIKELEQELKALKKSSTAKVKKREKKCSNIEDIHVITLDSSTVEHVMCDASVNTELEIIVSPKKPEVCERSIMTDEFYNLKDNPYPIFCSKCETFLNPPPIDQICKVMSKQPPLLDDALSPTRKDPISESEPTQLQSTTEETNSVIAKELPPIQATQLQPTTEQTNSVIAKELPLMKTDLEGNDHTAHSHSAVLMIEALEKKVHALESKVKVQTRKRNSLQKSCCMNSHRHCSSLIREDAFQMPAYPPLMSDLCKTLMHINAENQKLKSLKKDGSRNGGHVRKFGTKKVKLKNKKRCNRSAANSWSVETVLEKSDSIASVKEDKRKLKRKLTAMRKKNVPLKFDKTFVNNLRRLVSESSVKNIDINDDFVNHTNENDGDHNEQNGSIADFDECNDNQISILNQQTLPKDELENVTAVHSSNSLTDGVKCSKLDSNDIVLRSMKEETVELHDISDSTVANEIVHVHTDTNNDKAPQQLPCKETDIILDETTQETCDHLLTSMDYLCTSCGKFVEGEKLEISQSDYPSDTSIIEDINDLNETQLSWSDSKRAHDKVLLDNEQKNASVVSSMSQIETMTADGKHNKSQEDKEVSENDETEIMSQSPEKQSSEVKTIDDNTSDICDHSLNESFDYLCPSCGDMVISTKKGKRNAVVGSTPKRRNTRLNVNESSPRLLDASEQDAIVKQKRSRKSKRNTDINEHPQAGLSVSEKSDNNLKSEETNTSDRNESTKMTVHEPEDEQALSVFGKRDAILAINGHANNGGEVFTTDAQSSSPVILLEADPQPDKETNMSSSSPEKDSDRCSTTSPKDESPTGVEQTKKKRGRPSKQTSSKPKDNLLKKLRVLKKRTCAMQASSYPISNADEATYEPKGKRRLARLPATQTNSGLQCGEEEKNCNKNDERITAKVGRRNGGMKLRDKVEKVKEGVDEENEIEDKTDHEGDHWKMTATNFGQNSSLLPNTGKEEDTREIDKVLGCDATAVPNATEILPALSRDDSKTCRTVNDSDQCQGRSNLDYSAKSIAIKEEQGSTCDNLYLSTKNSPEKQTDENHFRSSPRVSNQLKNSPSSPDNGISSVGGTNGLERLSKIGQRHHFIPIRGIDMLTQARSKVAAKKKPPDNKEIRLIESAENPIISAKNVSNGIIRENEAEERTIISSVNTHRPADLEIVDSYEESPVTPMSPEHSDGSMTTGQDDIKITLTSPEILSSNDNCRLSELPVRPMSPDSDTIGCEDDVKIIPTSPINIPTSPIKIPTSPIKIPTSPIEIPTSPIKIPTSPMKNPMSPMKILMSPIKTPTSPIEMLMSPIKTPTYDARPEPIGEQHVTSLFSETRTERSKYSNKVNGESSSVPLSPLTALQSWCNNYRSKSKRKRARESDERVREATDAFVKKQLKRILDSSEWSPAVHRDIVEKLSSNFSARIIAKGIVEVVMDEAHNKRLDKQYTPPAPLMTKAQQKYLSLLLDLRDLKPAIFQYVEEGILYKLFRLNSTPMWNEMERLIRMYVVMARVQKNREKVRIFCLDALYCLGRKTARVFQVVFTSWPEVLPMYGKNEEILPKVIVHLIMTQDGKDLHLVKKMLMNYYHYPSSGYSLDNLLQEMLVALEEGNCRGLDTGLILLAKKGGASWTYHKIIQGGLLPSIVSGEHPNMYRAFCLLGNLMRPFPQNDPDGFVGKIVEQLVDLLNSGEGSAKQQEGIASALISLSRHKWNEAIQAILKWTPLAPLTPRTMIQLEMTFSSRTPECWRTLIREIEKSKKKLS